MRTREQGRAYYHKNKEKLKARKGAYRAKNKEILNAKNRNYYAKNKEEVIAKRKAYHAKNSAVWRAGRALRKYSITIIQWLQIYDAQGGECAICGKAGRHILDFTSNNRRAEILHTDHCHGSGKIRGLLCDSCNKGLGFFNDSKVALENAIDYLAAYPKTA